MKKTLFFLGIMLSCMTLAHAQVNNIQKAQDILSLKGEVIFDFTIDSKSALSTITKELSIVNYDESSMTVKVMANTTQFTNFLKKEIDFEITDTDNIIGERVMTSGYQGRMATFPLTAYPTYADYVAMMNDFASTHPTLCKVENIGNTTEGDKSILFVKLSNNVNANEQEPRVMYTSSMHGDEIAGYPMMLNLIDYLLSAYNDTSHPKHAETKTLLDNNEVWINPMANPDGTFRNSPNNTSVANATRGNTNNVDLNRNFPDPDDGPHTDGNPYQVETQHFMTFSESKHFVLSANFHGGIELISYPWDTYAGAHPDNDYFVHLSEEYRDLAQANSPAGYFDDRNNGITNGFAWYEVQGGRQDYMIYYNKGREITVELSNNKTPAASQLVNFWNYNKDALLTYLMQVNYGIRGVITDAVTGTPIDAKVTVIGKESYETWSPTEMPEGDYYRPIKGGTYDVLYEAPCYQSQTVSGVTIADNQVIIQDVQLTPIGATAPTGLNANNITTTEATVFWNDISDATFSLRYRVQGSTSWTLLNNLTTATANLSGLTSNTTYEAQVNSGCAGGATSPFSASILFTTLDASSCAGITNFPYNESFESGFGLWTNATDDDINWTRDSGGTPSNGTGPSSGADGSFYLYTEASTNVSPPGSPNKVAHLNSPCITIDSDTATTMTFGFHMRGNSIGSLELRASADDGVNYTTIWNISGSQGNAWKEASVNLTPYAGQTIKLQFKGRTGNGWSSDIAFDDLSIFTSTPDVQSPTAPTNLTVANTTSNASSLSWSAATDDTAVTNYNVYQDGTLVGATANTNYIVSGLAPETSYNFFVEALDAAGNVSNPSNTVTIVTLEATLNYCASQGNNVTYEYIDYVGIGGIDNTTGANGGYADFTALNGALAYGSNTITLSVGFASSSYTEHWGVWIDFNQDGTFTADEKMVSASTNSAANNNYSFTVPSSALSGATRMRVSMRYNAAPSPCQTFTYGEVEDYTVTIGSRSSSVTPTFQNPLPDPLHLSLYPNPVKEGTLYIKTDYSSPIPYTIYNVLGQLVQEGTMEENRISVSTLKANVYLIHMTLNDNTVIKRFIVD